jgi:hypothetical protein
MFCLLIFEAEEYAWGSALWGSVGAVRLSLLPRDRSFGDVCNGPELFFFGGCVEEEFVKLGNVETNCGWWGLVEIVDEIGLEVLREGLIYRVLEVGNFVGMGRCRNFV